MTPEDIGRRTFLWTTGIGAAAALGATAAAAELTDTERANVKTVSDFCAAVATRDAAKVIPFFSADCVYRMTETTPPITGLDALNERFTSWVGTSERIDFRVLDTHAMGSIVINHRIDRFVGSRPLTWEGVGVFFVKDGKIKEWSDYTIRVER